jgi:hypothetical protein
MPPTKDLPKLKEELAGLAQRVARDAFGMELDYSVESIHKVETVLGQLHTEFRRTKDDDGLNGLALEFAAYIIKAIELHFGTGTWARDHPSLGPGTFPYTWRGGELFPYAWCQKRIFDGPADDVWAKFQTLVIERAAKDSA